MTAIAAALGAGVAVGVILIALGIRGYTGGNRPALWQRARLLPRRLAIGGACGVAVALLTGWPVAGLLAAGLGTVLPGVLRRHRQQRRAVTQVEAIAGWAEMLRDTMAGAAGLESALVATASSAPLAIRAEVQQLAVSLTSQRIGPALRNFAERVADPTCDLVVAALLMAAEHQGRQLGELLGALAAAAREEAAMRLHVEAERARVRGDLQIIVVTVVGFMAVLLLVDRPYYTPYDSPVGQLVLAAIAGVFIGAFALLLRLAGSAAPQRLMMSSPGERS
ncbi:MAG: pilus assembly protein TadB [Chloroflexi bacterium]|nr:MAG: pilus assembly protein TadB [Chloroflexota bacterium]